MIFLIGLIAAASSVSGVSVDSDGRPVTAVRADDLDLTQFSDQRRLQRRVATAVRHTCAVSGRTLEELEWARRCSIEAAASARPQVEGLLASAQQAGRVQLTAR